ncbi:MAG: hypothetical protein QNK37_20270 [Acidobacteriota bacterium]|nr:hypothetical protein [Acidobacteriota bacterium]
MLTRNVIPFGDDQAWLTLSTDMAFVGDYLYVVENPKHQVKKVRVQSTVTFEGYLAQKGEGPGEVWLPIELLTREDGSIIVKDNRGFSFFDTKDDFQHRFRVFTSWISATWLSGRIYYAAADPGKDQLIFPYTPNGKKGAAFAPKFLQVDTARGDMVRLAHNESYLYEGRLLTDGRTLFYLNKTFGKAWTFDDKSKLLSEKNLTGIFGPHGAMVVEKNKNYLENPHEMEKPEGFLNYSLFDDAFLLEDNIYLLRVVNALDGFIPAHKDIFVLDKKTLTLKEVLKVPFKPGEYFWTFAARVENGKHRLYAIIDMGEDTNLVALDR